jgi:hypothetical protein
MILCFLGDQVGNPLFVLVPEPSIETAGILNRQEAQPDSWE